MNRIFWDSECTTRGAICKNVSFLAVIVIEWEHFREFGGEEGYIHEKFRKNGNKALCLPFLRWMHRFYRPEGPPYPMSTKSRLRNYVIGHMELGMNLDDMINHFISEKKLNEDGIKKILVEVISETGYKPKFKKKKMAKTMNPFKKIKL